MIDNASVAPTLASRLACACNCAYGISSNDGHYAPPNIYEAGVGWIGTPEPISAPEAGQPDGPRVNACLVGRNGDGIVLAFRGTLPPAWTVASLEDWWQDIVDSEPVPAAPLPGKVHSGFLAALDTLWSDVLAAVRDLRAAHPSAPLLVTGHSKGGPLASLGAARLYLADDMPIEQVITFASPHPGDSDFVNGYPTAIKVDRFENYLDLVPFLPPTDAFYELFHELMPASWQAEFCRWFPSICKALDYASQWHYESLGELQYVTWEGKVVGQGDDQADPYWRFAQILGALFGLGDQEEVVQAAREERSVNVTESGVTRVGAAHCIGCKCGQPAGLCAGGYMKGSGGNSICPGL